MPLTHARSGATILTPHDGEFAALTGAPPGPDRVACARTLAAESGAIVLLKGPCTVIAEPNGDVMLSIAGDQRLATAGTGDVLAGVIGALAAQGMAPAMPAWQGEPRVSAHIADLYAYLSARAEGIQAAGKPAP